MGSNNVRDFNGNLEYKKQVGNIQQICECDLQVWGKLRVASKRLTSETLSIETVGISRSRKGSISGDVEEIE